MCRGLLQRSSPSVSMVMMKGVLDMMRNRSGMVTGGIHDALESVEIGSEDPFFTIVASHEGAAAGACFIPGGRIIQQAHNRVSKLHRGLCGNSQALAFDHAIRIKQRDDGYPSDPRLEICVRETLNIRGIDQYLASVV